MANSSNPLPLGWQSTLSTANTIGVPYGGYWGWLPQMPGSPGPGEWMWFSGSTTSPANLDSPKLPYDPGKPYLYTDPTVQPDGKNLGNHNPWYTGKTWPDGTPNSQYVAPAQAVPTVTLATGYAPMITGTLPGGGSPQPGGQPNLPAVMNDYHIAPGSLRTAEINIDAAANNVAIALNHLSAILQSHKGGLGDTFYTPSGGYPDQKDGSSSQPMLDQALKSQGDQLAKAGADVVRLVGQLTNAFNVSGQMVAAADIHSRIPEA
jgi:hypothetical protein